MDELIRILNDSFGGGWFSLHSKITSVNPEYYDGSKFQHGIVVEFVNIYTRERYPFLMIKQYSNNDSSETMSLLEFEASKYLMNSILFSRETKGKSLDIRGDMIKTFADIKKEILEYTNKNNNGRS